jgi:uncharacterized protein (DUF2345 family)
MFVFDDTQGAEKVKIVAPGGASRLEFLLAEKEISLKTDQDVLIEAGGGVRLSAREIEMESGGDIGVDGGEIRLSAKEDLRLSAEKDVEVKGASVALN